MFVNHVLVGILWSLYGILHSIFASLWMKNFFRKKIGKNYKHYRLTYTVLAFAGLVLVLWFQVSIDSFKIFTPILFTKIIGGFLATCGLILMLICIKKYFMGLSGLRSLVQEETYTELLITGVHRYVRHPLYSGTFLFIWGLFILFPSLSFFISNAVITIYTLIGINLEEKKLVFDFGEQYKAYQKKVPKLIPKF
jgi:protein-S-isoprenylcysteine O-methyltransferase Ste14